MPVPTPPFTTGNDYINLYEFFDGTSGPVGNEQTLAVLGKTFQMGTGVDEIYIDASYSRMGSWFNITATESGLITLTNASGGTVKVAGAERIQLTNLTINLGTAAADTVNGSTGSDKFLFGLGGADTINGLAGADTLMGGAGNDKLDGGADSDILIGGVGKDTMTGGTGAVKDTFDFNKYTDMTAVASTRDIITDFVHLVDKIDLATLDANIATAAVNDKFTFLGNVPFNSVAGTVVYTQEDLAGTANDKTIIMGDNNGDGIADFHIQLTGLVNLTAVDFIL